MADLKTTLSLDTGQFDSGISSAISSVNKLDKQAKLASKGFQNFFNEQSTSGMRSAFQGVNQILNNLERNITSSSSSMKKDLRSMTQAAQELENVWRNLNKAEQQTAAGQQLRSHIDELIVSAGSLKDTMGDVQSVISFRASDTANLDALAQGVTTLSAGFQVAAGAANLFGVSEEKVATVQKNLMAVMALTNGLQTIQNALQKDSALMTFLRTTREQGLLVALGLRTIATTAATAAENAETAAIVANTAAWESNPIGWIVTAIAAVVGGVVLLTKALDDNNDELSESAQMQTNVSEQIEKTAGAVGKQISVVLQAKKAFEDAGDSLEKRQKVFTEYKKKLDDVGLSCKNAEAMHKAVVDNTQAVIDSFIARAEAAAYLAQAEVELGKVIAKVAELRAKAARGEEIETSELESIGITKKQFTKFASVYNDAILPGKEDWKVVSGGVDYVFNQIEKMALDNAKTTAEKYINKANEIMYNIKPLEIPDVEFTDDKDENINKTTKNTSKNVEKIKTEIEKLDEQIKKVNEELTKQGPITDTNKQKISELKNTLAKLKSDKIKLLPINSVEDIENIKKEISSLLPYLDKNSDEFVNWRNYLTEISNIVPKIKLDFVDNSTLSGLETTKQLCNEIINNLPKGHTDIEKYAKLWKQADDEIQQYNKEISNLKSGIQKSSITELKQQLSSIDKELNDKNLDLNTRIKLIDNKNEIQNRINKLTKGSVSIPAKIKPEYIISGSVDDKLLSYQNAQSQFSDIKQQFDLGIITKGDAINQVETLNERLKELGIRPIEIGNNFFELTKKFENIKNITGSIEQLGSAFSSLGQTIGGAGGAVIEALGTIAATIAQTIGQIISLMIANGVGSAMALPFPANLAAAAAVMASLATIITTIKSASAGNYANGGIVPGNSYHGDQLVARVNSGEMILNTKQQANLFKMLDGGQSGTGGGQVSFKIKGQELVGVLNNYNSKHNKLK